MDDYIVLGDGAKITNAHVLEAGDSIIIYAMGGKSLGWMYRTFSNREKTASITGARAGEEQTWEGYTELYAVRVESKRLTTACLRKPEEE